MPITYLKLTSYLNAATIGFSSADENITYDNILYYGNALIHLSAFTQQRDVTASSPAMQFSVSHEQFTADLLRDVTWQQATIEIFSLSPTISYFSGLIGDIKFTDSMIAVTLEPLTHRFHQQLALYYSPLCRAQLGDSKCNVDIHHTFKGYNCDKRFKTCVEIFNNAVHFRGEPDVPM